MAKANDNIYKVNDGGGKREEEELVYKYNLINTPWDDRTTRSKFGIVVILVSMFVAIMACVANLLLLHYRKYGDPQTEKLSNELNCHFVKMEEYHYIARIHSFGSQQLLCVGAVVSTNSILVNKVCIKSGPIRIRLGHIADPRCRKGYTVDQVESLPHDNNGEEQNLVILRCYDNILDCAKVIPVGRYLKKESLAYVIGRSYYSAKSLSHRPVTIVDREQCKTSTRRSYKNKNIICVKDVHRCPIRAGDMLVQDDRLVGLALRSSPHKLDGAKFVYFTDFSSVFEEMMDMIAFVDELPQTKERVNGTGFEVGAKSRG